MSAGRSGAVGVVAIEIAKAVTAQLGVKALPAQAQHFGGGGAIVVGQFERCLNAQPLDHVGCLAHKFLQRDAADEVGELFHRRCAAQPSAQ